MTDTILWMAALAQRFLPRGKGAVPRWLGRTFASGREQMLTRHGARLALARDSFDVYASMRLNGNAWDYHDFCKCLAGLPDGATFYDVGANVGYFSIEVAAVTREAVQVVAFEPQPSLAGAIRRSVALNGFSRVEVREVIVGDHDGEADLFLAPASIHASAVADSSRPAVGVERREMISLDRAVPGGLAPPDLIKIDVEGSEHLVLDGARRTIAEHKPHMFLEYMSWADPGTRIRSRLERILSAHPEYLLAGDPNNDRAAQYQNTWYQITDDEGWRDAHAVFLLNRTRPLRDPAFFQSVLP